MDYVVPRTGKNTKILLTGGHGGTTGIAVIEELKKRLPEAKIHWIGTKSAISGSRVTSLEHKIYPNLGIDYFEITAGKLQTKFTRYTIPLFLKIPVGFFQAFGIVAKIKPSVILSFGGFASFPVVFWGWFFRIPIIIHEQTIAAGRASIISSVFAKSVALSHTESVNYFPDKNKCIVTGNPLIPSILEVKPELSHHLPFTILVMGGSRGSEFINEEILKLIPTLCKKYKVVHITGERDFEKYKKYESENYRVVSFVNPLEMHLFYSNSDLIISRSGANTVSEIGYIKRPAILIPLPRTYLNEQLKNAQFAESLGLAKVLEEKDITSDKLLKQINDSIKNWSKTVRLTKDKTSDDVYASQKIVDLIFKYL